MGILSQVFLILAVFIVIQQRFKPVAAKPTVIREPVPTSSFNKDYQELLLILGKNLPGTDEEKAKVVDLMLQLLAEIDLPTLCQVIANDTTRQSKSFQKAVTMSDNINTDWLKDKLHKTALPVETVTPLPSGMKDDAMMSTRDTTAFASLSTEDSEYYPSTEENLADASERPFSIYKGYYSKDRSQQEYQRPKVFKYHSVPSVTDLKDLDDATNDQTDDVIPTEDYTTDVTEEEATHPDVTKVLNAPYTSQYLGNGFTKSINTDGTLPYPIQKKKMIESLYNRNLKPGYSTKALKAMRLRSIYNRLPENLDNTIEPTKYDESENSILVKSVEVERPKAQLYSQSLVLGDWFHGKSDFKTNWKSSSENLVSGWQESAERKEQERNAQDDEQTLRATDEIPSNYLAIHSETEGTEEPMTYTPSSVDATTHQSLSSDDSQIIESVEHEGDALKEDLNKSNNVKQQQHYKLRIPQRALAVSDNGMFKLAKSKDGRNVYQRLYQTKMDRFAAGHQRLNRIGSSKYRDFVKNKQMGKSDSSIKADAYSKIEFPKGNDETGDDFEYQNIDSSNFQFVKNEDNNNEELPVIQTTANVLSSSTIGIEEIQPSSTDVPQQTMTIEENSTYGSNNTTMADESIKGSETTSDSLETSVTLVDNTTNDKTDSPVFTDITTREAINDTVFENHLMTPVNKTTLTQTKSFQSMVESEQTENQDMTTSDELFQQTANVLRHSEETTSKDVIRSNSSDQQQVTESHTPEITNTYSNGHRSLGISKNNLTNASETARKDESSQMTTPQMMNKLYFDTKTVDSNIPVNAVKVVPIRNDLPGKYHKLEETIDEDNNKADDKARTVSVTSGIESSSKSEDPNSDVYSLADHGHSNNDIGNTELFDTVTPYKTTTMKDTLESSETTTHQQPATQEINVESSDTKLMAENSTQISHDTTLSLEDVMSTSPTPQTSYESKSSLYQKDDGLEVEDNEIESDDSSPNLAIEKQMSELEKFNKEHFPYQPTILESFQTMNQHKKPRIVTYIKNIDTIRKADNVVDLEEENLSNEYSTYESNQVSDDTDRQPLVENDVKTTLSVPHFIQPVYIDYGDETNDYSKTIQQPTVMEPQQPTIMEPQQPTVMEPQQATVMEPQQATVMEPQQATVMEPQQATVMEPQQATVMETQQPTIMQTPQSIVIETNEFSEAKHQPTTMKPSPSIQAFTEGEIKATISAPTQGSESNTFTNNTQDEVTNSTLSHSNVINVDQRNDSSINVSTAADGINGFKDGLDEDVKVVSEGKFLNNSMSTIESDSLVSVEQEQNFTTDNIKNISARISTTKANLADAKLNILKRLGRKMGGDSEYETKLKQALKDHKNSYQANHQLKNSRAKYSGMDTARAEKASVTVAYLDVAPIVQSDEVQKNIVQSEELVQISNMKDNGTKSVTTSYLSSVNITDVSQKVDNDTVKDDGSAIPEDKTTTTTIQNSINNGKRAHDAIAYHAFFEMVTTTKPDVFVATPIPSSTQSPITDLEMSTFSADAPTTGSIQTSTLRSTDISGQFVNTKPDTLNDIRDNYGHYYYGVFDDDNINGYDDEVDTSAEIIDTVSTRPTVKPNRGIWNLGLGVYPQDVQESYPSKSSAKPYMTRFSNWLSQGSQNSGYAPHKGFIQANNFIPSRLPKIDTWKAYNIALSKEKLRKQEEEASLSDYHDVHLYPDYSMEDNRNTQEDMDYVQESYPTIENYLWNARPWPKDLESSQFKSLAANNMAADKFGKLPQPTVSSFDDFSKNYDGLRSKLRRFNSPASSKQWGNRFSQGYYGRVFDDRSSFGETTDSWLWSHYPSKDVLGSDTIKPSAKDLKDYVPAHAENNHRDHENLVDFDTPGSQEIYETSFDNDAIKDSYRLFDLGTDRNEPIRRHSKTNHIRSHLSKLGLHSGSAESKIENNLYRDVQTSKKDVLPLVGSGGNSLWSSAASSLEEGVPAEDDFACPDLFGYHRDSQDCGSFFMCSWGMPYRLKCPAGTLWSQEQSVCDWAANVECPVGQESDY